MKKLICKFMGCKMVEVSRKTRVVEWHDSHQKYPRHTKIWIKAKCKRCGVVE